MTDEQLIADVRAFLKANWPEGRKARAEAYGRHLDSDFLRQVVAAGYAVPTWPRERRGLGLTAAQGRLIEREFAAVGAPGAGQDRSNLWANTAAAHAQPAFRDEVVPRLLAGDVAMCLLYSEPGAGSDLAGVRTRAERDGDDYVINGQKVWTSGAAEADYGMLICRTDWDAPKHKGLSFFFLPMKQPGIEVRPLRQITDEAHFNEVFITDARVPAANMLGRPGDGWQVLMTALAYERSVMGDAARGPRSGKAGPRGDGALVELAREAGMLEDPVIRQQIAQVTAWKILNRLNNARAKAEMAQGTSSPIMSIGKLAMSRILHGEAALRSRLLGPESMLEGGDFPRAEDANFLSLNAYFTSIGGGTDQIQRNIIGERVLGLPKEPEIDRDLPFREVKAG